MRSFKKSLCDKAMILGAILIVLFTGFRTFAQECEAKPQEVLRLHILANSDSEEDQALKYKLRDHMLVTFGKVFGECNSFEEAVRAANTYKQAMQNEAQRYIYANGYDYSVTCEVTQTYFTTRKYENVTLPAGNYTAVRFLIGEAEGKNWWCVMFPPLCLPAASGEFFTEEQSRKTEESRDIEIRFALFELLGGLFGGGCDEKEQNKTENGANDFVQISVFGISSSIQQISEESDAV